MCSWGNCGPSSLAGYCSSSVSLVGLPWPAPGAAHLDAILSHGIRSFTMAHVGSWQVPFLAQYPDFLAAGVILLASAFVYCGVHICSWLNRTFSAISLVVILFIVTLGFVLARPENWSTEEGSFAPFGFSGIMAGAATCFFAFLGFGAIAASSEEGQNPKRAVPMAIAISVGLMAGTNILASTVLTLMVPRHGLDPDWTLADAFYQRGYSWAGFIVAAGAVCCKRPLWIFTRVHPRTQVPIVGILVFGFLMPLLAVLLDLEALIRFLSIGTLVTRPVVNTSIIVLRFQKSSPSSPLGSVSPGPVAEGYEHSSGHRRLEDTEQPSAAEPGQLRPALRPFLGFISGCRPGAAVAWALRVLVVSAIILDCVLAFGKSALHLPPWGHTLLLLLSSVVFLLSLLVLGAHQQQRRQDTFQVPMVPLIPAASILLNVFLMLHLSSLTWLRFSIWLLIDPFWLCYVYEGPKANSWESRDASHPCFSLPRENKGFLSGQEILETA
ncbi:cationic amino acid transporter 4-like isoform X12 [Equus asinus]|uniref:cationic amino acid transporter 4-like isoform X12 n=1 Tax=Equus asinus TaxID=9793 RepID=UPI0038F5FED9